MHNIFFLNCHIHQIILNCQIHQILFNRKYVSQNISNSFDEYKITLFPFAKRIQGTGTTKLSISLS